MDFMQMMSQMGDVKNKMEEAKKRLDTIFVKGESGGVEVEVSASKKVKNISISEELMTDGDKEQIEDLLLVALNKAMENATNVSESEMKSVTAGILPNIPGLF